MTATIHSTELGRTAKIRNPWAVLLFAVLTLGIYYLVWYYKINREMSNWGVQNDTDIGTSPGMSVIAVTIGSLLIIPPFVSIWGTGKRMERSQHAAGVHGGSGPLWFVLHLIPVASLFAPVYMQYQLNQVWETQPEPIIVPNTVAPAFASSHCALTRSISSRRFGRDRGSISYIRVHG